jgi:carboxyl-terminal processing protease
MKKLIFLPVIFLTLFLSCKKDNIKPAATSGLTPAMARDTLYYIMEEYYYWYNLMPAVTKENYADPYTLLEAMKYKTLDRWSYILTGDEYNAEVNGTFVGHGIRIGLDEAGNARIAMIFTNSPLYANGVRRGWIVKKINGVDLAPILIQNDATAYNNLIGASTAGITNIFVFDKPDGTEVTITSTKTLFAINTVLAYDTLHLSSGVTGHLVFEEFFPPAPTELATAFAYFQANNITDLILDLRYNSGGYLEIAQTLASYIAGNSKAGTIFAQLSYNDKHPELNFSLPFNSTDYPLTLSRMAVITSRSTASASEDVINGLRPFVNIVTLGDTTNGKPTGMNGWDIGSAHTYYVFPVTFKVVNSQNQGDFFAGFAPSKVLADDISHDWSDRNEVCLKGAIQYLETGTFSSKSLEIFKRLPQFSEKPEWMNNAIIMHK